MIKETVQYKNFDGQPSQKTLHFHLTRMEAVELSVIQEELEAWQKRRNAADPKDEIPSEEVREFLRLFKEIVKAGYGERINAEDFRKSDEIWAKFVTSPAYDEFMWTMFSEASGVKAMTFMNNLMPEGLETPEAQAALADAREGVTGGVVAVTPIDTIKSAAEGAEVKADEGIPAYIREDREPTAQELRSMSPEQLQEAFRRRNQG